MVFDQHRNFAASTLANSPGTGGTSLVVQSGTGGYFPAPPFNLTAWPAGQSPSATNAEILRVTASSGDTFTVQRAQEGTTAQALSTGYQIANSPTVKVFTDIEQAFLLLTGGTIKPLVDAAGVLKVTNAAGSQTLLQVDTSVPLISHAAPRILTGDNADIFAGTAVGNGPAAEVWDGPATNLFPNPSFEVNVTDGGWTPGTGYSFVRSTSTARSGFASAELFKATIGNGIANISDTVNATVTMNAPHGLSNGEPVIIRDVQGATGANGPWVIGSVTSTTFQITNPSTPGTYSGGGDVVPPSSGGDVMLTSGSIAVNPGASYTLSWFDQPRFAGVPNYWVVDVVPATSAIVSYAYPYGDGPDTGHWWRHSLTFQAGPGDNSIAIRVRALTFGLVDGYLDAMQLEVGIEASSYLDGSLGYGYSWSGAANNSPSSRTVGHRYLGQVPPASMIWTDTNGDSHFGRTFFGNQSHFDAYSLLNIHSIVDPNLYVTNGAVDAMGMYVYTGYRGAGFTASALEGIDVTAFTDLTSPGHFHVVQGVAAAAAHFGSGLLDSANALAAQVQFWAGSGVVTDAAALFAYEPGYATWSNPSGNAVTNLYGLLVQSQNLASANIYGAYIHYPSQANGVATSEILAALYVPDETIPLGNTTASTASFFGAYLGQPTLQSATNLRTITDTAATLYVAGAPIASSNVALTNPAYALLVNSGLSQFQGGVRIGAWNTANNALYVDGSGITTNGGTVLSIGGFLAPPSNGSAFGAYVQPVLNAANLSGAVISIYSGLQLAASVAANAVYGIVIGNPSLSPGSSIATATGLYIGAITAGSVANYALYSGGGANFLGGTLALGVTDPGYSASVTLNVSGVGAVSFFNITTSSLGNATVNAANGGSDGQIVIVRINNDSGASRTITFGSDIRSSGPVVGIAGKTITVCFTSNGTSLIEAWQSSAAA